MQYYYAGGLAYGYVPRPVPEKSTIEHEKHVDTIHDSVYARRYGEAQPESKETVNSSPDYQNYKDQPSSNHNMNVAQPISAPQNNLEDLDTSQHSKEKRRRSSSRYIHSPMPPSSIQNYPDLNQFNLPQNYPSTSYLGTQNKPQGYPLPQQQMSVDSISTTQSAHGIPLGMPQTQFSNGVLTNPWEGDSIFDLNPPSTRYFRFISSTIPASTTISNIFGAPIGFIVTPCLVDNPPILDCSDGMICKCSKCNVFLSPGCIVNHGYHTWVCFNCKTANSFSGRTEHPEADFPVYDVILPSSIEKKPVYCICADLSNPSMTTGFTQQFLTSVKASLTYLPQETLVFFATMDSVITVFDFNTNERIVITDLDSIPTLSDVPCQLGKCIDTFSQAIDMVLSEYVANESNKYHCIFSFYEVAYRIMETTGGVLLVNLSGLPGYGPFRLSDRTNMPETEQFATAQLQNIERYEDVTLSLCKSFITVCLFVGGSCYSDILTVGSVCGLTSGHCKIYPVIDTFYLKKLHNDVFTLLTSKRYWRSHCSVSYPKFLHLSSIIGNLLQDTKNSGGYSSALPAGDSFIVTFVNNPDAKVDSSMATFQVRFCFVNDDLQNIVRVFTFSVPVTSDQNEYKSSFDEYALGAILIRKSIYPCIREGLSKGIQIVSERLGKYIATGIPIRSIPHVVHGFMENSNFSNMYQNSADMKVSEYIKIRSYDVIRITLLFYPRLHIIDEETLEFRLVTLSVESLYNGNLFILHTDDEVILWIRDSVSETSLKGIFGVNDFSEIPNALPEKDEPINQVIRNHINDCFNISMRYLSTFIIPQGDSMEPLFMRYLHDSSNSRGADIKQYAGSFGFKVL